MQTKTENATVVPFDPWLGASHDLLMDASVRRTVPSEARPPGGWYALRQEQRELLGGMALYILAAHGPYLPGQHLYLRARFVEALSATHIEGARGGYGHDLAGLYERDEEKRESWRLLGKALQGEWGILDELLPKLAAAGDIVGAIRARVERDHALLERVKGLVGGTEMASVRARNEEIRLAAVKNVGIGYPADFPAAGRS